MFDCRIDNFDDLDAATCCNEVSKERSITKLSRNVLNRRFDRSEAPLEL